MEWFDYLFAETDAGISGVLLVVVVLGALALRDLTRTIRGNQQNERNEATQQNENTLAFIKLLGSQAAYIEAATRRLDDVTQGQTVLRTIIEKNYGLLEFHGGIIKQLPEEIRNAISQITDGQKLTKTEILEAITALRSDVTTKLDALQNAVERMPDGDRRGDTPEPDEAKTDSSRSDNPTGEKEGQNLHSRSA